MICNYKNMLDMELNKVHVPANWSSEIHCSNVVHSRFINNLCNAVVNTCIHCGKLCIPQSTPNRERSKSIPYWKDNIKSLKDKALFWHWIWLESGKTYIGVVGFIMKHTRYKYHYAMRAAKRADSLMRRQRLADACANNNDKDMWKELKLMNPRQKVVSRVVDDAATGTDMAKVFGRKYESVYNSSPTSADNMNNDCG